MSESHLPVWYLQAGILNADGEFEAMSQGSAVLVSVRRNGETRPRKMLITAQHVLRSGMNGSQRTQRTGAYYKHVRAWAPESGYNDSTRIDLTLYTDLLPDETMDLVDPEDLLFLEVPREFSGSLPARWLLDDECQIGLGNLNIVGYVGGDSIINNHMGIVKAAQHAGWTFSGVDNPRAICILSPGSGPPAAGASGGGVFHGTKYAGVYRGAFHGTGQHLFLPVTRLREWCAGLDYELLDWDIDRAVNDIQQGLTGAMAEMTRNAALKNALADSGRLVRELKDTLGLFKTYKRLHDCLHAAELHLPGLEIAARTLNVDSQAADDLDLAVEVFQKTADSALALIGELPAAPVTLRSKETAWQQRFHDAVGQARGALNQGQSPLARLAAKTLRSLIKIQHPRINGELRSCAEGMDLEGLMKLFDDLSTIMGTGGVRAAEFQDGRDASGQIHQQLKAQLAGHNAWQDIDTDLWNVEEELEGATLTSADIVGALWNQVTQRLRILTDEEPSAIWSKNLVELRDQAQASFDASDWAAMSRQFSRFQRVCRRRFYDVDSLLKDTAEKTAGLAGALNQILTQLAP